MVNTTPNNPFKYLSGVTISGNVLQVNYINNEGIISMDNTRIAIISGNSFTFAGGPPPTYNQIVNFFGSYTSEINLQSNAYEAGFNPAPSVPAWGSTNIIGGGSA